MTSTTFARDTFLEDEWHRRQIHDTLLRYCRGIDRQDFDLAASAYHEDGFDDHGTYKGDIPGFIAWVKERHVHVEQSMHVISNCIIERNGDVAVAETYFVAYQRFAAEAEDTRSMYVTGEQASTPAPMQVICTVRYVDRFERRNGEWKIARRTVVMESVRSEIVQVAMPESSWVMQRRDPSDALWQVRRDAGLVA